jgi:hypothetical protein
MTCATLCRRRHPSSDRCDHTVRVQLRRRSHEGLIAATEPDDAESNLTRL